jgi:peptidoglycan hydrolase-like protein with peptidoglycan-binding domain
MRHIVAISGLLLVAACASPFASGPGGSRTHASGRAAVVAQPSAEVRDAQQRLRAFGFYEAEIDGLWGPATQAAVERYQRERGLEVTAKLDTSTLRALRVDAPPAPSAATNAAPPITLSDPSDVRTVQNHLRQSGFFNQPADGQWSQSTQVALENFQRARGLPVGQMTSATLTAMGLDPTTFPSRSVGATPFAERTLDPALARQTQQRLRQLGFYSGRDDAIWGPSSRIALTRFQQSRGLEATGQLDQTTVSALGIEANPSTGSSIPLRR